MGEVLADLWGAVRNDLPFDEALAIVAFWQEHWKELGSPVGPERITADGSVYQAFSRGIVRWTADVGPQIL